MRKSLFGLMFCTALPLALLSPHGWTQDGEKEGAAEESTETLRSPAIYVPLEPAFVVNYGGQGRLRFLKAELTARVSSEKDAASIRYHMPSIRNQLILLLSQQTQETLETQEGKEQLRQAAFETIHSVVVAEEGELDLIGVYFNQLLLQP